MRYHLVLVLCFAIVFNPLIASSQSSSTPPAPEVKQAASTAASTAAPTAASTGGFALEDATPVKLRISRTVSSADAKTGDTVDFEVLDDVKVHDVVVIPRGGVAWATVTEAQSKKRMARGGKLNMNIDSVRLVDGEKVALRAVKEMKGGGHTGAMTGAMVATGIVFFPAAPLFLFMHGKDITIPKGTEITAYVNGNIPLEIAKFTPSAKPSAIVASNEGSGRLQITSTPPGADIEIDGNFVGNTPASLTLPVGEHTIVIKKSGHGDWQRKLKVNAGEVNLTAELEKAAAGGQ